MFRKYEKTYRILVPQVDVRGKHFLSSADLKKLLTGKVTITEKIDGANAGIIRSKEWFKLQKKGSLVDASEHEQFNFFKAWAALNALKIMTVPKRFRVYGELMRCQHTIFYDQLPDWFLVFAVYDHEHGKYVDWTTTQELCEEWGFSTVPLIAQDTYVSKMELFDLIPDLSNYGPGRAEGIVVWNYRKQMRGKLVRKEFIKHLDEVEHWSKQKLTFNKLAESRNETK